MSKMAVDHNAINLSQGFPDFDVSERLISLIDQKMKEGFNQYAPMPGVPKLLSNISAICNKRYGYEPSTEKEMLVTSGATEALFSTFQALVSSGDEVILLDPCYDSYDPAIRLNGGIPKHLSLKGDDFHVDWDEVEDTITNKTKALVINTPHNPSGTVMANSDIKRLEEIVERHGIYIISDEVYEWIIFDGKKHQSILQSEILRNHGVAIYSFGKTFHATGWKVGYAIAPEYLMNEMKKIHQFITFSINTPVQHGLAEYIDSSDTYESLPAFYEKKRDYFTDNLVDSRFEIIPCHGTYFQLLSYRNISDRPDTEMAEWLTKEHGVASIPISVFYEDKTDPKMLRFCYAKQEETLKRATDILCRI